MIEENQQKLAEREHEKNLDDARSHYKSMDKERINISNLLDKYLLTFSTGTLALSVSFTEKIISRPVQEKLVLGLGWGFLILTIISTLVSILITTRAFEIQLKMDEQIYTDRLNGSNSISSQNCLNPILDILQVTTILTFVAGIIILSVFYFINLV